MSRNVMKWTLGLLAVGCVLAMSGPVDADFDTKDSADFPTWGKYEMNIEPVDEDIDGNSVDDFLLGGAPVITFPESGVMKMDTSSGTCYYKNVDSDQTWDLFGTQTPDPPPAITFANGYTFECRVKIAENSRKYGMVFFAAPDDGVAGAFLNITDDGLSWGYYKSTPNGNYSLLGNVDNHTDFHIFRVVQAPGQDLFRVWRDGVEVYQDGTIVGDAVYSSDSRIMFGDMGSDWGTVMEIDYLRFTSGAYAPIPEPGTLVLLAGALLSLLVWRRR